MKDGSGRWLPSRWEDLLQKALIALDSLEGGAGPWTFYRASTYTPRDAFDLAAIHLHDRAALAEIARSPAITHHVVSSALNRLNLAKVQYQADMRSLINATPRGEAFIDRACEMALQALAEIRDAIPESETES